MMKIGAAKRMVTERAAIQRRAKEILSNPNLTELQKRAQICDLKSQSKYASLKDLCSYINSKLTGMFFVSPNAINPIAAKPKGRVHAIVEKYVDGFGRVKKGSKFDELNKVVTRNLVFSPEGKDVLKNSIKELESINYRLSPRSINSTLGALSTFNPCGKISQELLKCSLKNSEIYAMRQKELYKNIENNATFNPLKMVVNGFRNLVNHFAK